MKPVKKERILLKRYDIKGIPVGVNIDKGGYLVVATADRFVSCHKLVLRNGVLLPWMFAKHTIGEYRRREETRGEGKIPMSDALFDAHRKAVRQYLRRLPEKWCDRLFFLGKVKWVPDGIFEAEDTGRIVLEYGDHKFFFQRRDPKRAKREKKDLTKYVHWGLDADSPSKAADLSASKRDFKAISHWPNVWAAFFADRRPSQEKDLKRV